MLNLRHCQFHSTTHQTPINRCVVHIILGNLWTGAHSSCVLCSPARASLHACLLQNQNPGNFTQNHAWGSQEEEAITIYHKIIRRYHNVRQITHKFFEALASRPSMTCLSLCALFGAFCSSSLVRVSPCLLNSMEIWALRGCTNRLYNYVSHGSLPRWELHCGMWRCLGHTGLRAPCSLLWQNLQLCPGSFPDSWPHCAQALQPCLQSKSHPVSFLLARK
jgi:hypothetical protein